MMKLVIVESPYAGDLARNLAYLELCLGWCVKNKMSPYASHKMLTTCLDDDNPKERKLGIEAGLMWYAVAEEVLFFTDFGWSRGMRAALNTVLETNMPFRTINLRELPDAAADFNNLISRLPGNPEPSVRSGKRHPRKLRDERGSLHPADEAILSTAGLPTGEQETPSS